MEERKRLVKDRINEIARLIYLRLGGYATKDYDLEMSRSDKGKMAFDIACLAWEEISGQSLDLYDDFPIQEKDDSQRED